MFFAAAAFSRHVLTTHAVRGKRHPLTGKKGSRGRGSDGKRISRYDLRLRLFWSLVLFFLFCAIEIRMTMDSAKRAEREAV